MIGGNRGTVKEFAVSMPNDSSSAIDLTEAFSGHGMYHETRLSAGYNAQDVVASPWDTGCGKGTMHDQLYND